MELENKPRKLSVVILSSATCTQMTRGNAANGNNGCLQLDYQSSISPQHPDLPRTVADEVEQRVSQELSGDLGLNPREIQRLVTQEPEHQSDSDTPLPSPEDLGVRRVPMLLFHGATDDEEGHLHSDFGEVRTESGSPLSSREHDYYQSVKMPLLLFDESQEHEPPPPSPIPAAGPLRPLLRPLPTPEQSPAHVVHNILPFRCASSGCATLTTAYPSAPAPTPITNEPTIMVYPLRNAQVGPLSPVSEVLSPLASRNLNLRFEKDREYMRSNDCVISASMTEWPKTRTIIKTPAGSARSSPLMVPPPIEPHLVYDPINRLQCS